MKDYESETDRLDCPFCEGQGEQEIHTFGQWLVVKCEECRGTGEAIELTSTDFDDEDMIKFNG
jgi:DnaJ-class molecular chaperone